jgi:hypothetical protein
MGSRILLRLLQDGGCSLKSRKVEVARTNFEFGALEDTMPQGERKESVTVLRAME